MVADNLPDDQVDGIKKMFHLMDTDKNGNLSFQELKDGLNMIGHSIPDADVQMLLDAVSNFNPFFLFINFLIIPKKFKENNLIYSTYSKKEALSFFFFFFRYKNLPISLELQNVKQKTNVNVFLHFVQLTAPLISLNI